VPARNRCLLWLSDRETEAMAAAELDAVELPVFVAAVSDVRRTDRTPLRRHSLRLLALVAGEHPRDAVALLVPRLVAANGSRQPSKRRVTENGNRS